MKEELHKNLLFQEAFCLATLGKADAVLAASIFHFGEHSIAEAKRALLEAGVAVRPPSGS